MKRLGSTSTLRDFPYKRDSNLDCGYQLGGVGSQNKQNFRFSKEPNDSSRILMIKNSVESLESLPKTPNP